MNSPVRVPAYGPKDAKLYIVGEAPGKEEEERKVPFVGSSGVLLTRMLQHAGVDRALCRINNVVQYRPPNNKIEAWWPNDEAPNETVRKGIQELLQDIREVNPEVILLLGGTPLRALFGYDSVLKWRGSHLEYHDYETDRKFRCIPCLHPTYILRQPEHEFISTLDIKRAWARATGAHAWPSPAYNFKLRPSFACAVDELARLSEVCDRGETALSVDIETRKHQIACIGIASSPQDAISIPFMCIERADGYYSLEEEVELAWRINRLLTHPNARIIGQNFAYDIQYLSRYLGISVKMKMDTMIAHHSIYSMLPKGLDFLSSLYLEDHVYWKDDGKEWDPRYHSEDQYWRYNCVDAVRTFAIAEEIEKTILMMNYKKTSYGTPCQMQHRFAETAFKMMLNGVKIHQPRRAQLYVELNREIEERTNWLSDATGYNAKLANSPKQLCKLFYEDLGIKPVIDTKRKVPGPTVGGDALDTIAKRDPLAAPICQTVEEVRALKIFRAVTTQPLDHDGRMRCLYKVPGTNTYRFASEEDAFGFGTNLQNISAGSKYKHFSYKMPNLRTMFVPDPSYIMGDYDGAQADARVVAWEADDDELKAIFRDPSRDIHIENAITIFGGCSGKSDPRRQLAKTGVHAANYDVSAPVLAESLGITVHEADNFLRRWNSAHPKIAQWRQRVRIEISTRRYVENAFGYRGYFFGRIDEIIKEAIAWIPQSTVAIMINEGMRRVDQELPHVDVLLQTHDSGTFQFPLEDAEQTNKDICRIMQIEIPYDDPLVIPIDSHMGDSWGACK